MAKRQGYDPDVRRKFDRLAALSLDPPARRIYAAELVRTDPHPELLRAALDVLTLDPAEDLADTLRERYAALDSPRRDAGGFVRTALVRALRPLAGSVDVALFVRAATTRESTPQDPSGPGILRAAGLVALNDIDEGRARLVAVQALAGPDGLGGDAGLTAVRVLAADGDTTLLYYLALAAKPKLPPEFMAEALRGLATVPSDLLRPVMAKALGERDGIVTLGLADLLVAHDGDDGLGGLADELVAGTPDREVLRSVAFALAASRREPLILALARAVGHEFNRARLAALHDALELAPRLDGVEAALAEAQGRLAGD